MNDIRNISKQYFQYFSKKDIESLKNLFDKHVKLRDWEIEANGLDKVLEANKSIFDNLKSIEVTPINLFVDNYTVIAELDIVINKKELLKVIDIIDFNENNKIVSVRAFKG
tara:strand:+ start:187 stop:519 length:333 start_codon:yes stop_codon:yes gene_type:complete